MKQFLRSGFLLIAACLAMAFGAHAQTVLYATDFPDDQGWTFTALNNDAWWDVDATPSSLLGSPSWVSPPFSLNFNDGANYGGTNKGMGTATSPAIDLSAADGTVNLGFWCAYDTETGANTGCIIDRRAVQVSNDGFQSLLLEVCYPTSWCGPPGQWHFHSLPLEATWGAIQIRFYFNTGDYLFNVGAGWLVDDLEVIEECTPPATYCTTKLNSQGCFPQIYTTGTPSLGGTGTAFRIWAGDVLNQKVGLMLWSRSPASTPFGGGTLCVSAPITRTTAQNSGGTSLPAQDCTGTYVLQFTPAMMSQAGLLVGDDVYSQYWSRDNGFLPPNNVGLTGGVHWEVCQ